MDSEYESTSTETASDSSSNVTLDDISSIASEVVGTGCRFLGVVIELGNNMTSLSEANLWQEGAATPLQFLLDQLDLSEKNIDWRCIAGSYALYCFETDVLCRPCRWKSGDIDIFHVCTYTKFIWCYFYPFLVRLWSKGFRIRFYSDETPVGGELVTPLKLMGYAVHDLKVVHKYDNMAVDALFDVNVSAITHEIERFSFLLNSDLSDTLEVVDNFDIDICKLRMVWPNGEDQYTISAPKPIRDNITMQKMTVTFRNVPGQNKQKTRKRKEKYERRGYNTITERSNDS